MVEGFELRPEDNQMEDATPFKLCDEIMSIEHEDGDPSECVFESNPGNETDKIYQNFSNEKPKIVVNTALKPSLSQYYGLQKNCTYDKAINLDFNIKYTATDHHCKPGGRDETIVGQKNSRKQTDSGKRRRSRWDQDPEYDNKKVIKDDKLEKGKAMCDADDSMSRLQEPLQLADWGKLLCGSLLDLEVISFKRRFSEISSILSSLVDEEGTLEIHAPEKLIKERDWIFWELLKRNAIFYKKLYIPVKEYPTYNFIGLILGPKRNTQKRMELKSGARIRLRGKTLFKTAQEADPSEDEDLYVYIQATNQKSLDAAACMVEKLLIPVEDAMNDHKRAQLLEHYDLQAASFISSCNVCKETRHNQLACPLKKTTLKAACDTCGNFSHPTSGCPVTPINLKTRSPKEIDAANIYIGFLPQTIDDNRLRELFSPFGTITQSRVILDMRTGYSKGYGFVKFDTPSAASLAILHMNGHQIDGHKLVVRINGTPPATSLFPVCPNPGPAAVATSYSVSPHYMMPQAQVSALNVEGIVFPSSLNNESNSQTDAPIIAEEVSGSTGLTTAAGFVSSATESRIAFSSTSLVSGSRESNTTHFATGLVSAAACSSTVVATSSSLALPDCMMPQEQVSVLNTDGSCYPSLQHMEYSTNIYVGFLPKTINDSCLWELFSPFGTVTQSKVILDMRTGYSKGYGFVSFDTPFAASLAIMHMNGYEIDGHRLAVRMRPASAAPPTGPPAKSPVPVYSVPRHTAVPTICPALPPSMMPIFSPNMECKNQNESPIISQEVSGSTGSTAALPSTAFVLRSTELGTASLSAGSRTSLSSPGLVSTSTELRSVISSYSFSSLFCGNPGSRF